MLTAASFYQINSQPVLKSLEKEKESAVLVKPKGLKDKNSNGHKPSKKLLSSILAVIPESRTVFIADIRACSNLSKSSIDVGLRYLFANEYVEKRKLLHNGRGKAIYRKLKDIE